MGVPNQGECTMYGRGAMYRVLVEKPKGKRLLRRHTHRWEEYMVGHGVD